MYTVLQQQNKQIILLYKNKEVIEMALENPVKFFRNLPKKKCPECGEHIQEQAESYFMECERCLAKKAE